MPGWLFHPLKSKCPMPDRAETERLADQLRRALGGDAWLGPPLMTLLADVSAEEATARPVPSAHTVAELVGHLLTWAATARVRLDGTAAEPTLEEDWPACPAFDDAAWRALRDRLGREYEALAAEVAALAPDALEETVPGKPYTAYVLVQGVVQHLTYHAGQIALVKRALRG